jgi:CRISPR-associated protein Cpf1
MDKKSNKVFRELPENKTNNVYRKVNYKLLPGASKMLPKVFFSNSNIEYFQPNEKIIEIRNYGTHTKSGKPQEGFEKRDFDVNDCRLMIDFFKASIEKHTEWRNFNFEFSETNTYPSIDEFYREVESQGYSISDTNIDAEYIDSLVENGKLYLFQIYNKDFSEYSKGTPNMHTLYWKMLFDQKNLDDVVYKLNGQAEVFYRKSSINNENAVIHVANEKIANKNSMNVKKESVFSYNIVKDKRYTLDKFQFHVPITLNFKNKTAGTINETVNHFLKQSPDTHIIGIDRGERHLLYLSLIDPEGKIVEQFSLNEIANEYNGNTYRTNYHDLLQKREKERMDERQSWKAIETIKELKEGYISQVIHKIATLMVEYNAIVVMEDLNFGFMRGRQKVEKSVYQKFEKMLIDKLNYLVDKKKDPTEPGGTLKALQLTNKFESFKAMGKQNGFLFYVPAWNTSKIDPVTGYVNMFDTRYESVEKAQKFFQKFEEIRYNAHKDYFEFVVDNYTEFNPKAEGTRQNWIIGTHGDRIKAFRNEKKNNQWDNETVILTPAFKDFFRKNNINFEQGDIKSTIVVQNDKKFFDELMHLFQLTVQMRNSITNSEIDYMVSPVADKNGKFYDSRTAPKSLPKDADANGAYNIARKGLWVIEQIKKSGDDFKNLKLAISNREWLQFVQKSDE